jgi:hypothetical protein
MGGVRAYSGMQEKVIQNYALNGVAWVDKSKARRPAGLLGFQPNMLCHFFLHSTIHAIATHKKERFSALFWQTIQKDQSFLSFTSSNSASTTSSLPLAAPASA